MTVAVNLAGSASLVPPVDVSATATPPTLEAGELTLDSSRRVAFRGAGAWT